MQDSIERLRNNIGEVFLGDTDAVNRAICCLLARGHLLIEDVPGVGKTILAMSLARSLDCSFNRIQLTPDMLPNDVLGVSIYNRETSAFEFKKGPIFANIVLADEVNRTSPRTQSALLEAMNEATVSVDGEMHTLSPPFMVIATQNPMDFEGAYPLPESQLDRFLMRISLGYPTAEAEARVLELRPAGAKLHNLAPVLTREEVLALQQRVDDVKLDGALAKYIIALATASREDDELQIGLSPRASLALAQAARATAVMNGREYCVPEDITANVLAVCSHRVFSAGRAAAGNGISAGEVVMRRLLKSVPSPA
ncbi:MAG: AAA family ATPase [Phycisphaeraceae bacterium]|nr:MAG: AAA family ATPase [Phycisphaeraceae bacterium]